MSEPFDITKAPIEELQSDLSDSRADIVWCQLALSVGVLRYGGPQHDEESVAERLRINEECERIIVAELKRRRAEPQPA